LRFCAAGERNWTVHRQSRRRDVGAPHLDGELRMRVPRIAILLIVTVALAVVLVCIVRAPTRSGGGLGGWCEGPSLVAKDGRTYRLDAAWWTVGIVREDAEAPGGTSQTLVAEAGPDSPCRYVVLMSAQRKEVDRLVEAADGTLVALNSGTTYLAFDPKSGRTIRGESIADISPFLLLGPSDAVPEASVKALEGKATDARDDHVRINWIAPSDDALVTALEGPNASVHDAARRIAKAGGEKLYPKASRLR
jgi:hypothetical protein